MSLSSPLLSPPSALLLLPSPRLHYLKFLFLLSLLGHAISSVGLLLGCLVHVPIVAVMLCLARGTRVRLFDGGTKLVEEIEVEDLLVGRGGRAVRLRQPPKPGTGQPMFTIDQNDDAMSYTVTGAHRVTLLFNRASCVVVSDAPPSSTRDSPPTSPSLTLNYWVWENGRPVMRTKSINYQQPPDATDSNSSLSTSSPNGMPIDSTFEAAADRLRREMEAAHPLHDDTTGAEPREGARLERGTLFEMRADLLFKVQHELIGLKDGDDIVLGYREPPSSPSPTKPSETSIQARPSPPQPSSTHLTLPAQTASLPGSVRLRAVRRAASVGFVSLEVDGDERFQLEDGTLTHNCPLTVVPFMLTSGFFINLNTIPAYLSWITVLSPHRYAFAGLMGLELDGLVLHCDASEKNAVLIGGSTPTPLEFDYCSMVLGRQVLELFSLPRNEYITDVWALILLALGYRLVAFILLEASVRENRVKIREARRSFSRRLRRLTDSCRTRLIAALTIEREPEGPAELEELERERQREREKDAAHRLRRAHNEHTNETAHAYAPPQAIV